MHPPTLPLHSSPWTIPIYSLPPFCVPFIPRPVPAYRASAGGKMIYAEMAGMDFSSELVKPLPLLGTATTVSPPPLLSRLPIFFALTIADRRVHQHVFCSRIVSLDMKICIHLPAFLVRRACRPGGQVSARVQSGRQGEACFDQLQQVGAEFLLFHFRIKKSNIHGKVPRFVFYFLKEISDDGRKIIKLLHEADRRGT